MRSLLALVVALILVSTAFAQQNENQQSSQPQAQSSNQQKTKKQKQTEPQKAEKPEQPPVKPTEPVASQPQPKAGEDKKEEHFDMTEVPPVVTHHQVSVNGKTLKYSATAGRLPIKRDDGKIEAEMFFVAYTLDGQDGSKHHKVLSAQEDCHP